MAITEDALQNTRDRCSCGHDKKHHFVHPKSEYSFWGWFGVLFGISVTPRKVYYVCEKCGESFGVEKGKVPNVY